MLGISSDDVDSHVAFLSKLDLPFQLLADEGGEVRKEYGVPKDLLGFLEGRQTYVIGKLLLFLPLQDIQTCASMCPCKIALYCPEPSPRERVEQAVLVNRTQYS